jgi:WD40 repeat protein
VGIAGELVAGRNAGVVIARDAIGNVIVTGDGNQITLTVVAADPRLAASPAGLANPYRGLDAFRETDSALFFGREDLVRKLWTRFHALQHGPAPRLLPVLGASGSGKSSLVRAGLLPELVRQPLAAIGDLRVHVLRPGAQPLARLAEARAPGGGDGVHELIFVDQLEEVFTECAAEPERAAFLAALAEAAAAPDRRTSVVFAMRSDFTGALLAYPAFAQAVREHGVSVSSMTRDQLATAIAEPARALGRPWPSGLVEALVVQCEGRSGALPLLQFALTQLWTAHAAGALDERRWSSRLIEDFLVQVADALVGDQVSAARERIVRRAFTAMVQLGEGAPDTRRTARLSELVASGESAAEVRDALAAFAAPEARLVTIAEQDGEPTYELAHEALIGAWGKLRAWLGQVASRDDAARIRGELRLRRRLRYAAELWRGDREAVWRPPELEQAIALHELSTLEHDFVAASLDAWQADGRWRRRVRAGALVVAAVIGVLGLIAWRSSVAATRNAEVAHDRLVASFVEHGRTALIDRHPMRALAYLLAAREDGVDDVVLRTLWAQATKDVPVATFTPAAGVVRAAFSTDATRVITASADREVQVWDVKTGAPVGLPIKHNGKITAAAFSPDGTRVLTASLDGTARIWDAQTGRAVLDPIAHGDEVLAAQFNPDGTRLVTVSAHDTAQVWNAQTGKPVTAPLSQAKLKTAMFVHHGAWIATVDEDHRVRLWDAATGGSVASSFEVDEAVAELAFSDDGERMATADRDGVVRVRDVVSGALVVESVAHGRIESMALTFDGACVVTRTEAEVWVWGTRTRAPVFHRREPRFTTDVAVSGDGKYVLIASEDHTARVWNTQTNQPVTGPLEHRKTIAFAAFSANAAQIVTVSVDGVAWVWKLPTDTAEAIVLKHAASTTDAKLNAQGTRIVTVTSDGKAWLWDVPAGTATALAHDGVVSAGFSLDGLRVVTAGADRSARVWDARDGTPVGAPIKHDDDVRSAGLDATGRRVVTASGTHAQVWEADTGRALTQPMEHWSVVTSAALDREGARVLTTSEDRKARVWEVATARPIMETNHRTRVRVAAFSPRSTSFVTGDDDGEVEIWDARTGKALAKVVHSGEIRDASFNATGTRVVTASFDGTARVWNATTGAPETEPLEHHGSVWSATFSADDTRIATVSGDIRLWDARTGKQISDLFGHAFLSSSAAFTPDGTRVMAKSNDGNVRIWTVPIDHGSLADWRHTARCAPFKLDSGVLVENRAACP